MTFAKKVFGPGFFLQYVVPFHSKEVGYFFGTWTTIQENGSSLLCDFWLSWHFCDERISTSCMSDLFIFMHIFAIK